MKIGVVQFPGSNCERETKLALMRNNFEPIDCYWHSTAAFVSSLDGFVIVGGFSYEDRVRSGLIAAKNPFMHLIKKEAARGKPILGICNGAQILVESGLVPGFEPYCVAMALTRNHRSQNGNSLGGGFYNDWVYIKTAIGNAPIRLPIAHAEGRFLLAPKLYQALQLAGAICYYYCDANGNILPEFPINPNGSHNNLAAVGNFAGNVLAMMPHPERTPEGDIVFKQFFSKKWNVPQDANLDENLGKKKCSTKSIPIDPCIYTKQLYDVVGKSYNFNEAAVHYWIALLIHDNEAISLETTLQQMGLTVSLKKRVHWQVTVPKDVDKIQLYTLITASDELFNRQKEYLVTRPSGKLIYFVRDREDEQALIKQTILRKRLHLPTLSLIREIVWQITCPPEHIDLVKTVIEDLTILANPLAHYEWLDEH